MAALSELSQCACGNSPAVLTGAIPLLLLRLSPAPSPHPNHPILPQVFKYILHYLRARASCSDAIYLPTDEVTRHALRCEAR